MDKKYKINFCEVKRTGNTNGRAWSITEMALVDEEGNETTNVSTFDSVAPAQEIEGQIVKNEKGYLNFVKKPEPKQVAASNFKTAQMEKTMERKENSIKGFQDNKELSIKISSTFRDAVALSIAEGKPEADRILAWRKWLWNNYDVDIDDTDAITGRIN